MSKCIFYRAILLPQTYYLYCGMRPFTKVLLTIIGTLTIIIGFALFYGILIHRGYSVVVTLSSSSNLEDIKKFARTRNKNALSLTNNALPLTNNIRIEQDVAPSGRGVTVADLALAGIKEMRREEREEKKVIIEIGSFFTYQQATDFVSEIQQYWPSSTGEIKKIP